MMIWVGVLIAALVTFPVSTKIHEDNIVLAQAEQEKVEIAAMSEYENADDWCDPKADN
jgi:hypothetical protein